MENLIKQICMRIFHVKEENKAQTSRVIKDRKISSRRTRSYKGDSWKSQDWGQSKLQHEKSHDDEKMEGEEFRTAVAAAAFAISSIENQEQEIKQNPNSNSKPNTRKSLSEIVEVPSRPKTNEDLPGGANQPKPTVTNSKIDEKGSVKTVGSTSPVEKTPVANKQSDEKTSQKEAETKLTELDIWEKTHLDKTKERFIKAKARIFEWENKKKSKAKVKLIRKEGKLEWKRAQLLQDFKRKIEKVEKISKGAISKNDENRKRQEIRVKEKTSMIRSTEKVQKPMFLCC